MPELRESVLSEMDHRGRSMVLEELLALIERYHPTDGPGVPRSVVDAYVAEMEARGFADADGLESLLADRLTDDEAWVSGEAVYRLADDRISVLPPDWHDRLGGSDDLRQYVDVIDEALADEDTSGGAAGSGVTKQLLVEAATILGDFERAQVRERIQELRDAGELVEDADQHPEARIYTTE